MGSISTTVVVVGCYTVPPQRYYYWVGEVYTLTMEGWHGVSGVPGLGCAVSVSTHHSNTAVLRLWEDGYTTQTFKQKITKFFGFKNRKTPEIPKNPSLPKIPVKRSLSAVTVSQRKKGFEATEKSIAKEAIKRSVSFGKIKDYKNENRNKVSWTRGEGTQVSPKSTKSQSTQTDLATNESHEDYDYVYSNWISPAMLIKIAEQFEVSNEPDNTDNIYEEICPKVGRVYRSNSLFNHGSKEELERNFGDKDNYIRPQAMKEGIVKKIQIQKTNESKTVTFSDPVKKLRRTKSVMTAFQPALYSNTEIAL